MKSELKGNPVSPVSNKLLPGCCIWFSVPTKQQQFWNILFFTCVSCCMAGKFSGVRFRIILFFFLIFISIFQWYRWVNLSRQGRLEADSLLFRSILHLPFNLYHSNSFSVLANSHSLNKKKTLNFLIFKICLPTRAPIFLFFKWIRIKCKRESLRIEMMQRITCFDGWLYSENISRWDWLTPICSRSYRLRSGK